jgi:hypothetical protein
LGTAIWGVDFFFSRAYAGSGNKYCRRLNPRRFFDCVSRRADTARDRRAQNFAQDDGAKARMPLKGAALR